MQLEWVTDAASVLFCDPADDLSLLLFRRSCHNKASQRQTGVPRDIVDLVTVHENILPLGAVLCAAVGKFPVSHRRKCWPRSRGTAASRRRVQALATEQPIEVPGLHRRIRAMIEDAEAFITGCRAMPSASSLWMAASPVQPDPTPSTNIIETQRAFRLLAILA